MILYSKVISQKPLNMEVSLTNVFKVLPLNQGLAQLREVSSYLFDQFGNKEDTQLEKIC